MKKKKRNTLLAVFMTLVLTFLSLPTTAKADISTEQVVDIYSGTVNGVERTLVSTLTDSGSKIYFKVGDADFKEIYHSAKQSVVDTHGTIWVADTTLDTYSIVLYWNYDLTPDMNSITFLEYDFGIESFITEGSGSKTIGIGYKTSWGEIMPFPSFSTLKRLASEDIPSIDSSIPEPHYIPSSKTPILPTPAATETPELSSPTPIPIATETPELSSPTPIPVATEPAVLSTSTPVPTVELTVAPKSTTAPKLSIKRSKTTSTIYEGKKVVSKATLKKGSLTWKRWVEKTERYKTKTYKGVKSSALILKSKNLVYLSKKGVVDIISYKTGKRIKRFKKVKSIKYKKESAEKIILINGKKISIKNL